MRTKLQLALDDIDFDRAIALTEQIQKNIDIIEIGTPFLMEYGMYAVREFHKRFPDLEILCDGKIMDAGSYEARLAYAAGADYVTVLAVTDDQTIADTVAAAKSCGKKVMADLICVSDLPARVSRLEELGVDVIAVHTGVDQQAQGRTPLDDLRELKRCVTHTAVAAAGGIHTSTLKDYLNYGPEIIIVGSGIVHAADPLAASAELAAQIQAFSTERRNSSCV